jgi:hypothetical protein
MTAPVEFAAGDRRGGEHIRSLARAWNVSEARAVECLADPGEYRREMRSRMSLEERRRELERRYPSP